jgi:hypothetical protein
MQGHNSAMADLLQRFQKGMINLLADMITMKNRLHSEYFSLHIQYVRLDHAHLVPHNVTKC